MLRPRSLRLTTVLPALGIVLLLFLFTRQYHLTNPFHGTAVSNTNLASSPPGQTVFIDEDPAVFEPPAATIQHSVIRGDGAAWTNDQKKTWYSVGRHPNRPECWTYDDRFHVYENLSPLMTTTISDNNKINNSKRVVLLRLHSATAWSDQFGLHARALVLEAGYVGKYDVVILVHSELDEAGRASWLERVPDELRPLVQFFSTQDLREWIPGSAPFKNVFEHNHIALQRFMAQNVRYEFVYTIEYDVRLIGRWDTFLDDVDREYRFHRAHQEDGQQMPAAIPDLVSFQFVRRPKDQWQWFEDQCTNYFGGKQNIRATLGMVWGMSRRMVEAMTRANQDGINCYYEYFAPSIAYKEGLTSFFYQHPLYCPHGAPVELESLEVEALGRNDPRKVQIKDVPVGCTYHYDPDYSQSFWEEWHDDNKVCRPPALLHPIKGDKWN
ncbi:hypothetical protein ABW21_db0208657 [Orbilia brochopaga]|nr:hypothetical protein ABW21_db0208657 [Drechslerella brochopaga]